MTGKLINLRRHRLPGATCQRAGKAAGLDFIVAGRDAEKVRAAGRPSWDDFQRRNLVPIEFEKNRRSTGLPGKFPTKWLVTTVFPSFSSHAIGSHVYSYFSPRLRPFVPKPRARSQVGRNAFREFRNGCPGGTNENSSAFQRWDVCHPRQVPKGRLKHGNDRITFGRPFGTRIQSTTIPALKRYYRDVPPGHISIEFPKGIKVSRKLPLIYQIPYFARYLLLQFPSRFGILGC